MNPQVGPDHYCSREYNTKGRFCSYWHQIDETIRASPRRVLEVGVGGGLVSKHLRNLGIEVVTLDIDSTLHPDVCGSILEVPFSNESFDVVMCCEVLEHLPYSSFVKALSEIHEVTRKRVIISLPDAAPISIVNVEWPRVGHVAAYFTWPFHPLKKHQFDGQHYWEIGKKSYQLSRILGDIKRARYEVERNYRVPENPTHRFLVLVKGS